jgi:hypothetical protein
MRIGSRRVVALHSALWRCSAQWLLGRRPGAGPQDRGFPHRGPVFAMALAMLGVSVVEVVLIELVVPWPPVRAVLLVVGLWGAGLVLGALAVMVVRPHLIGPDGVRVRYGPDWEAFLPRDAVAGVRAVRRARDRDGVDRDGDVLRVVVGTTTTVEIVLSRPLVVRLPRGDVVEVSRVALFADDTRGFVAAARGLIR